MNWMFSIQAKVKIAFLLALICALVLVNIVRERSNMTDINDSFRSIYDDRLLPATYVFHLTDHLYQKRLIVEHQLHRHDTMSIAEALQHVAVHNRAVDTLVEDFEQTYLVDSEAPLLHAFKQEIQAYNILEKSLLEQPRPFRREEQERLITLFETTLDELTKLSQVQIDVGRAMRDDSLRRLANTKVLTMLEAALIVVIALIIQGLIFASRSVTPPGPQRPDLN